MVTGVYGILNTVNGKIYVGSARKSIDRRWVCHRHKLNKRIHWNKHLQSAWNKFGGHAFQFFVIDVCLPSKCFEMEQHWIDTFDSTNSDSGYNQCPVAGSPLGYKHTDETKAKVSVALKGKKKSVEHAANIRAGKQNVSDETKKKMSDYAKSRTEKHRKKLGDAMKGKSNGVGKKRTLEGRKNISDGKRKEWAERKEAVAAAFRLQLDYVDPQPICKRMTHE